MTRLELLAKGNGEPCAAHSQHCVNIGCELACLASPMATTKRPLGFSHMPTQTDSLTSGHPVILYDGTCKFCGAWVVWVIGNDPAARFRFAAMQSPVGRQLLSHQGLNPETVDSVVLLLHGKIYLKSEAAWRIFDQLKGAWRWLAVIRFFPRAWRDWAYDAIALRRYRWFGRHPACPVPTAELRSRFLD